MKKRLSIFLFITITIGLVFIQYHFIFKTMRSDFGIDTKALSISIVNVFILAFVIFYTNMFKKKSKSFLVSFLFYIPLAFVLYLISNSVIAGFLGALSVFFVPYLFKKKTKK